nr:hypothetical protein GCM10020093_024880 [Planobispora longispora]
MAGLGLYRANVRARLRRPLERRTAVPAQVVVALRDAYVTPDLAETARRWAPEIRIHRFDAPHWMPATHPGPLARLITEHVEAVERAAANGHVPG